MINIGSSLQESKYGPSNLSTYPKSAPVKNEPSSLEENRVFGNQIYSMHQDEELIKKKKMQKKAYFQELTRQIQEKIPQPSQSSLSDTNFQTEKSLKTAANLMKFPDYPVDIQRSPEIRPSRYQKKYEIENHSKIGHNLTQVFDGVLQRDEILLKKQKKFEQQREIQTSLALQIQEKNRFKEELRIKSMQSDADEVRRSKDWSMKAKEPLENIENRTKSPEFGESLNNDNAIKKMVSETEGFVETEINSYSKSLTLPVEPKSFSDYTALTQFYQQLQKEKNELSSLYEAKAILIKELEGRYATPTKSNPPTKIKLATIDEKLEIQRKRPIDSLKAQNFIKKPLESKATPVKKTRVRGNSSISTMPKTPETALDLVVDSPDRTNLDTAGQSMFIYPDSHGNFKISDEIDKFVSTFDKTSQSGCKSVGRARDHGSYPANSSARKSAKPLMMRFGFPTEVFRTPN